MIEFTCPSCGKDFKAPPTVAGHTFACHQCGTRISIPRTGAVPKAPPAPPPQEEEVLEVLPAEEEVLEVLPADRPKPKKKKRGLIFEGKNGVLELRGSQLIIYHDGGMGYDPILDRRVRRGTYKHLVLSITDIDVTRSGPFGTGIIRFRFGHERKDSRRGCPVIDEQAITFSASQQGEADRFVRAVETMKRLVADEMRMRRM